MKTCCEQNAPAHSCNSGRQCPVRAARDSGVCCTEPDTEASDTTAYLILMAIVYGICAYVLFGASLCFFDAYGAAIKSIFLGVMARIS